MKDVLVGQIVKPQGIKGEMKIYSHLFESEKFKQINELKIDGESVCRKILSARIDKDFVFVTLDGINSRNEVESLRHKNVYISNEISKSIFGEILVSDTIGFNVVCDGKILGKLCEVNNYGSRDVYTIKNDNVEILFAEVPNVIETVDQQNKEIKLNKTIFDEVAVYED